MLIRRIFIFFISLTRSINTKSTYYEDLPKCCEVDSVFVEENDSFLCNSTKNLRVAIQSDFINVDLNNTKEYDCVEAVNENLFLFKKTLHNTSVMENISYKMLPKCCPVGYYYEPVTHSCAENFRAGSLNATFLKVGLPKCEIINDYTFQHRDDIQIVSDNFYVSKFGERIGTDKYCIDETVNSNYVVRVCEAFDICKSVLCVHKCCPDGQSFVNGSHCTDTYIYGMDLSKFSSGIVNVSADHAIIHGYKTKVYIPTNQKYRIDNRGNFYPILDKLGNEFYSPEEETYCIEHATKNGQVYGHILFRMVPLADYVKKKFLYNRWAMVISNIFLLVTVSYYVCSKETRKVFGKTLVSFCTALFTLFSVLAYCTFNPNMSVKSTMVTCKAIGFALMYLCFSCFVWLQVMCYDIYWTFGSSKRYSSFNNKKQRDLKRFICYSLYGWGVPLVMILILLVFHFTDILPPSMKIKVGETKCLIEKDVDNYAEILFYIIPLTLVQSVNVVFFVKTVRYCLQVKGNIQKMNQSADLQKKKNKFRARKERFGLVIKLSFIMGFFYLFEVVSSFYDFQKNLVTEHLEIIWDFINCLQGFFIFVIFVCKMKFLKKCSKKAAMERIRKISNATNSTRTTIASSERKLSRDSKRKYSKEEAKNKFG